MPERNLQEIEKKKCDYVLAVKDNNKTMFEEIKELFSVELRKSSQIFETNDKGHGRVEKRIYYLDTDVNWFSELIIRRIIYNRIKMQLKPKEQLCFGKRSCMYDDEYRLKIMFSHA